MTAPARLAVVGNPVAHSRSPAIHALFARACADAVDYQRLLAPLDGFVSTLGALAASGALGCNVTVPFKAEAFAACPRRTPRALAAGAVNTVRFDAEGWLGDNTDGAGLVRDIEVNVGLPLAGCRVLLLGAGGAAAGSLGPLLATRPKRLVVVNRTRRRADELVARFASTAAAAGVSLESAELSGPGDGFDLLVNATAASLVGELPPLPPEALAPGALVLDMMYGAAARPFLAWAQARGARTRDGLGMLVEQAAEAYALWFGHRPATGEVLAALRRDVDHAA